MVEQDNASRSDEQNDPFADEGIDDAAWLLADFGGSAAPVARPDHRADHVPTDPDHDAADGLPLPAVPERPLPPSTSPVRKPPQWMAVGTGFQPLPSSPLFSRVDTPQPAAVAIAEPGSSVHAVVAGVVHRSGTGLELRADDGRSVGYRGDAVVHWTAGDGERVPPGAVLGWVSAPRTAGSLSTMMFFLIAADGRVDDPVGWLAGLADPGELGLSGGIAGGVDPFLLDLRLAGHLDDGGDGR